ncbi:hypothetical protein EON65_48595 [archaeon]|nr:MAG: hypothetical protein EON65_48595 [archaeon]
MFPSLYVDCQSPSSLVMWTLCQDISAFGLLLSFQELTIDAGCNECYGDSVCLPYFSIYVDVSREGQLAY